MSVFDLLDDTMRGDLKHFKAEDIADIIRESFPNKDIGDYFTAGRKYQTGGEVGVGLEDLIGRITTERPDLPYEGMQDIMSKIAFHESGGTGDIGLEQYGGGPGRGVYQFERGAAQGGATAGNRLANQLEVYGMEVPKWLKSFNKSGKGDVSGLSRDKQDMLFLGNMLQHPQANMGEVISGDMGLAEFWQQYHQAGGEDVKDARIAAFAESMGGYSPDRRRGGPVYGYQQGGQVDSLYKQLSPFQGPSGYGIVPPESTRELRSKLLSENVSKYLKEIETEPDWYRHMDKSIIPEGELTRDDIMRMRYRQQYERVNADVLSEQFEDNEKMQEFLDYYVTQKPLIEDFERRERMEKSPQGGLRGPKARYARRKQHQQGGPIDYYQTGGQALPRKQQEVRNAYIDPQDSSIVITSPYQEMLFKEAQGTMSFLPGTPNEAMVNTILDVINRPQVYNMPSEEELRKSQFVGPLQVPDTSAQYPRSGAAPAGTQEAALDSMLKQIMMRGVNQATDDSTASTVLDSMKMQQGGMVGGPQLMQDMSQDRRIKPLQPDRYIMKDDTPGGEGQKEMEVPKLKAAYLGALGIETPLSKRQGALLSERGIPPQSMAPHLNNLVGRVLIQRLGNEPQ
jgi:hypothetical protein